TIREADDRQAMMKLIGYGITILGIIILILRTEVRGNRTAATVEKIEKHAEVAAAKSEEISHRVNGELDERLRRLAHDVCESREKQILRVLPSVLRPIVDESVSSAMANHE